MPLNKTKKKKKQNLSEINNLHTAIRYDIL